MAIKTKEAISEKQAASYFRKMMEQNVIPVAYWDFDGHFLDANDALLNLLGYTRKDLEDGKLNWKTITPHEFTNVDQQITQQLKARGVSEPFEKKYKCKDGSLIKVRLYNILLEKTDHRGVGIVIPL